MSKEPIFTLRELRDQDRRWEEDPANQVSHAKEIARRKKNREQYRRAMAPLLQRLRDVGLVGEDHQEMFEGQVCISPEIVDVLLSGLDDLAGWPLYQDGIVRELHAAAMPFDGRPLVKVFHSTPSESLKWTICYLIAHKAVHSIDDWLESVRDGYWGKELRKQGYKGYK